MDINFEQKVRERAYHIWMAAGMADGNAHDNWLQAEAAVAGETGTPVVKAKKAAAPKKAAPAKKGASEKPVAKKAAPKATAKTSKAKH